MESNKTNNASQEESGLSLKDIWALCINHWKWFAVSLAVCLMAATYVVLTTVPVYTRSASVLIKEDRKSAGLGADVIVNFLSPDLMQQVVKNLNLDVNYKMKGRRYDITLYGTTLPVLVTYLDDTSHGTSMLLSMIDSTGVKLYGFERDGDNVDGAAMRVNYGDTVQTPVGPLVVSRSAYADRKTYDRPIAVSRGNIALAARSCSSRLSAVLSGENTTVINLGYRDVNTQRAEDVLRMVINVYNENWIKDKNQITTSTNEFIAERLNIIEQELGSVDKTITAYRSTHRLPDAAAVTRMDMEISAEASKHLLELNNQLSIARFLQSDVRGADKNSLLPANVGLDDSSTQGQITQYNTTMLQRNRLVESSSEENLLVIDLDQQLASLRTSILTSLDNYIRSVNIQIQSAQRTRSSSDARVSDIPLQAGQLLSDERQQKVKEALYLFLLQKREENELSQAFTSYNTRVVASPGGSRSPVSPNKKKIYLLAFLIALAIPFAILYLREVLNTTVRGRKDLENLSAPFLGELPAIYRSKGIFRRHRKISDKTEDRKIVVKPHNRDMINEAFRVVRTNLEYMTKKGEGGKVLMVTSFNVGAGKTFVSSNLSTALAIKGRKTIIVDLDLRKRSLSALAGQPKKGIADYLSGHTDTWEDLIVNELDGNKIDVLPVGTLPPNPAELLGEPRLADLINQLRNRYEYVMLDCPPIEIVTDSDLIAPYADSTIFVIRTGLFDRGLLPEVERNYQEKKYNNMTILLNGSESSGRYGYRYGYRYGHKYGYSYSKYGSSYGYGSEQETKEKKEKK